MAIDPKLVSIKKAADLPSGIPTATGEFLYFEDETLMKAEMSDLYDRLESAYLGIITPSSTIPSTGSWYGTVLEPGTFNNVSPAITVDAADFDVENGTANNEVRIIITEGVASKDVRRVKGEEGSVNIATQYDPDNGTDAISAEAVDKAFFGYDEDLPYTVLGEQNMTDLDSIHNTGIFVYLFDFEQATDSDTVKIQANAAGNILLNKYERTGTNAKRTWINPVQTTLVVGENTITLPPELQNLAINEHIGVYQNTTSLLGRIASKTGTHPDYKVWRRSTIIGDTYLEVTDTPDIRFGFQMIENTPSTIHHEGYVKSEDKDGIEMVTEIKGMKISSGSSEIGIYDVIDNLPTGNGVAPTEIAEGRPWIDMSNGKVIKVK